MLGSPQAMLCVYRRLKQMVKVNEKILVVTIPKRNHYMPKYGERCLALRSMRQWCSEFENGREILNGNERAGRPRVSLTDHNAARMSAMVKTDRRVRIKNIAQELDISFGSAFNIIHECLGYRKVSCRWIPKQFDDVMKGKRMIASLNHLQRYAEESENFLDRIVTGEETWLLHYTPESKQQSMVWKHPQSPVRKNSVLRHLFTK